MDERGAVRFNKIHAPAGSAAGGQFAAASGSSAGKAAKGKDTRPTPTNQHPVGRGETGKRVSDLQERLNAEGFKPPLKVDGIFGPKTLAAVRAFQKSHGLRVDGLVGPKTTAALRARAPAAQHKPAHAPAKTTPAKTPAAKTAQRAGGQVTNPGGTEKLHQYWVHGEGAAKIRWGSPGDYDRCVLHLGKYLKDPHGYCAQAHHDALGIWPATHAAAEKKTAGRSAVTTPAGGYDPDGLDKSWEGDHSDLPDLTGLGVSHMEAAEKAMGMPPPAGQDAQRAMPKLGSGARFAKLKSSLAAKGASDPGALAAYIGRRKFGKAKFAKIASKARGGGTPAAARAGGEIFRYYPLDDIRVMRAADGEPSGRVVEAYATVFDEPAEIHDAQGHYTEVIDRGAFDQVLARISRSRGGFGGAVRVLFNHGKTMEGVPAPEFQRPIGKALDIRPDGRGLLTRTEYAKKPFAEEILDDIREGRITGQSFVGGIIRSDPELRGPGDKYRGRNGVLATVRRMTLGLREYGPVLYGAYTGAEFLGVRMATPGGLAGDLEPDLPEDEESTPAMEGDAAGGTPGDVTSTPRYHAHRLLALRIEEICRETGIGPLRSQW